MDGDDLAGHDQLWQELLEKFLRDFLELTVPEFADKLRFDQVEFLRAQGWGPPVSPVSLRGRLLICDLVARAASRDPPPPGLVVDIEVEYAFRQQTERRLHHYQRHLALRYPDEPVLTIVLYLHGGPPGAVKSEHREAPWGIDLNVFYYYALGLSQCRAEDWVDRPQPLAAAFAALMRGGSWSRLEHTLRCLQAIARAQVDERGRFLLVNAVRTYLRLTEAEDEQLRELLSRKENTKCERWHKPGPTRFGRKLSRKAARKAMRKVTRKAAWKVQNNTLVACWYVS